MINISKLIKKAKEFEEEFDFSKEKIAFKERDSFLKKFPKDQLDKILTLETYSTGYSNDSFSNWVEKKTKNLATIGGSLGQAAMCGVWSTKELIKENKFKIKENRTVKTIDYNEANKRFIEIKKSILDIISYAKENKFERIDEIKNLWPIFKSKILFLYYPDLIISVMKKEYILKICNYLSIDPDPKSSIQTNNNILKTIKGIDYFKEWNSWRIGAFFYWNKELNLKSKSEEIIDRNYYLLGSKYGKDHQNDVYPSMINKSAISLGFCWDEDLSNFINKSADELEDYLKNKGYDNLSISSMRDFLNIKEGDLIAIKSTGSPVGNRPRLIIKGFAVAKKKEGFLYQYDPDETSGLGHLIHVEFIEKGIDKDLKIGGYNTAIRRLRKHEHIKRIFGALYEPERHIIKSSGVSSKNTNPQIRNMNSSQTIIEAIHNKIQQKLYDQLVVNFGTDKVTMEKDFVDIILIDDNDKKVYYEVKSSFLVIDCIQEATGQLLKYLWKDNATPNLTKIVVVGQSEPDMDDKVYIEYIKNILKVEFEYINIALDD